MIEWVRWRWLLRGLFLAQRRRPAPSVESLLTARREFDELGRGSNDPPGCTHEVAHLDGVRVEWLRPHGGDTTRVLLYLHGGAYVMGSPSVARSMFGSLVTAVGTVGCSVDYRLAPEHPFPAGLEDAITVYAELLRRHGPSAVAVAGDSAGGGLALAMLVAARDRGLGMPAAVVLTSPWADLTLDAASHTTHADRDPALETAMLAVAADAYLDGTSATDPLVSPVHADLRELPPMLVLVGSEEILHDDATTIVERARAAGVDAELLVGEGMIHCFTGYADMHTTARHAVATFGDFVRRHLGDVREVPSEGRRSPA